MPIMPLSGRALVILQRKSCLRSSGVGILNAVCSMPAGFINENTWLTVPPLPEVSMDTSGKGGTVSHVFSLMNPAGIEHTAFKMPTPEERKHDFLWRITNALPDKGMIGIFDRSHYEDVLVVRVENLVLEDVWGARYDQINDWEATLADSGTRIIKCFLHISPEE